MEVLAGSTDVTTYFKLRLAADGTAATGLTITELDLQYVRSGATPVAKVDATALGAANSSHGDNQAIEVDATDQPGLYRVDWPDAAFASGVREVILTVKHTTIFTEELRVNLTPVPVDVRQWLGTAPATPTVAGVPEVDLTHVAGSTTNVSTIPASIAAIEADTNELQTDDYPSRFTTLDSAIDAIDNILDTEFPALVTEVGKIPKSDGTSSWNATALAALQSEANDALVALRLDHLVAVADADDVVDNSIIAKLAAKGATADWSSFVNTTDSLEAMRDRGDAAWTTATGFSTHSAADVWAAGTRTLTAIDEDSTTLDLDATIRAAVGMSSANLDTQLADLPTVAEFEARTLVAAGYFDPAADTVANVTTVGTLTGHTAQTGDSYGLLTSAVADSVPADGTRPSPVQAIYMLIQAMTEGAISGTTWTIKKVDGSTTLFTVTLDDGTTPASKTRSG